MGKPDSQIDPLGQKCFGTPDRTQDRGDDARHGPAHVAPVRLGASEPIAQPASDHERSGEQHVVTRRMNQFERGLIERRLQSVTIVAPDVVQESIVAGVGQNTPA